MSSLFFFNFFHFRLLDFRPISPYLQKDLIFSAT